ncbi:MULTISPECIES: hypothetical protein [Bacillus]|uniref:hypothetical protein n=1 Tax=Bacillus TaxID=1386 RepID=UPI0002D257D5|nr:MULTISPECIES: hypothetical protein [Bacillus]
MRVLLAVCMIISILLGGCDQESVHPGKVGFITQFESNDKVLIGDVLYHITRDTKIRTSDGDKLHKKDLKIGMKIQPFFEGGLAETYPGRANAKLLRILTDENSKQEAVMMINVIDQLRRNEDEHFLITNIKHVEEENKYIMDVKRRSNVDMGFTITVDEDTYKIQFMEV